MLFRQLTHSAASLLPSFMLAASASACFAQPPRAHNGHTEATDLGDVLQQSMVEFPLSDIDGNEVTVGRLVYGVSRNDGGSLDFFYQFFNYSPQDIGLNTVTLNGFSGVNTEVHALAGIEENLPVSALRSEDGSKIDFLFDDCLLTPGEKTLTLVVRTDADRYEETGTVDLLPFVFTGGLPRVASSLAETQVQSFAPATHGTPLTVPLPAPVWSTLAGLLVTVIYVIRHK